MAKASASIEAMEDMIKGLTEFLTSQRQLSTNLKKQYRTVGEIWQDEKYEELERVINEGISSLGNSYIILSDCQTKIQLLKRALEEYIRIKFN